MLIAVCGITVLLFEIGAIPLSGLQEILTLALAAAIIGIASLMISPLTKHFESRMNPLEAPKELDHQIVAQNILLITLFAV